MKYKVMWVEENQNYFDLGPALLNYSVNAKKVFGYGIKHAAIFGKNFTATFYLSEDDVERNREKGYGFFMKKSNCDLLLKEIHKYRLGLEKSCKKLLSIDLSELSSKELFEVYVDVGTKLGPLFTAYSMTQPDRTPHIEEKLEEYLEDQPIASIPHAVQVLSTPLHTFNVSLKATHMFRTFSELLKAETAKIDMTLMDQPLYTIEDVPQDEKNALLRSLNPPAYIEHIIYVLSTFAEERLQMRFSWMLGIYYSELFLIELKRRYGVSKSDLRMYDLPELDDIVWKGKMVSEEILKERKKGFLKVLDENTVKTYVGDAAVKYVKEHLEGVQHKVSLLDGRTANLGRVKGPAIVFSYKHPEEHTKKIQNMKGGEIIVSEMTRPNLVMACRKAAAIVTDEGGALCHAAIIAREFDIPCIVGTGSATRMIKDGDMLDVDGNKGTVRIGV